MPDQKTIIIYHGDCPDGFGGAFAAWKKFGDTAQYVPIRDRTILPPDVDFAGATVYMIDIMFDEAPLLKQLTDVAESAIGLDHHKTNKDLVQSLPGSVYTEEHSGCVIAWQYFFPETPTPVLLQYIEQGDLWKTDLPRTIDIKSALYTYPMDFMVWDHLMVECEDADKLAALAEKGKIFAEYHHHLVEGAAKKAELVEFEGYQVMAVNASSALRSDLGNLLAERHGPFAIVWYVQNGWMNISLRGKGEVDVSELASRYGDGGGHHNAAGFRFDMGAKFPWSASGRSVK